MLCFVAGHYSTSCFVSLMLFMTFPYRHECWPRSPFRQIIRLSLVHLLLIHDTNPTGKGAKSDLGETLDKVWGLETGEGYNKTCLQGTL